MKPSILVVDDERTIGLAIERLLTARGYDVAAVQSGEEAIERLRGTPAHVVITDLNLGSMSGMDVLRWLREHAPELFAGAMDRRQIARARIARGRRFHGRHRQVAAIHDVMPEAPDALEDPGNAERARPHVDAAPARPEIHRHAEKIDGALHAPPPETAASPARNSTRSR